MKKALRRTTQNERMSTIFLYYNNQRINKLNYLGI